MPPRTSQAIKLRRGNLCSRVEQSIFEAELSCIKKRIDYAVEDILNIHNDTDNEFKGVIELLSYHQEHFNELVKVNQRSIHSLRKYQNCLNHLAKFLVFKIGKSDIDVRQLNLDFITEFDHYLRTKAMCEITPP